MQKPASSLISERDSYIQMQPHY